MSAITPAQRIRTKTSDITEFFRGGSTQSTNQTRPITRPQISTSTIHLDVPSEIEDSANSPKKRTSRIPFLGRTRKKSTPSTTSGNAHPTPTLRAGASTELTDPGQERTIGTTHDHSHHRSEKDLTEGQQQPSLAAPSLGSKLAAHFTHSRPRKPAPVPAKALPIPHIDDGSSTTLLAPNPSPRATSFDSGSSSTSQQRSTTPRPSKPKITVSALDAQDDYRDLFTLPEKRTPTQIPASPPTPPPKNDEVSSIELRSTRSGSSENATSHHTQLPMARRGSSRMEMEHGRRDSPTGSGSARPSTSSSSRTTSSRKHSPAVVKHLEDALGTKIDLDSEESEGSLRASKLSLPSASVHSMAQKRLSAPLLAYGATVSSPLRSRGKTPTGSPTQPPSVPLPPPPPRSPPPLDSGSSLLPSGTSVKATVTPVIQQRPRAHTVASPSISSTLTSPPIVQTPTPPTDQTSLPAESSQHVETFDINTATPNQVKQALITRNQQYDELASYLLKLTASHMAEKTALEKKIASLEREIVRREKETKGLKWMITNEPTKLGFGAAASRSVSTLGSADTHRSQSGASSRTSFRRVQYTDDSGAESHPTSGAESIRGSGTSGNESASSLRARKFKRSSTLGDTLYRTPSAVMKRSAIGSKPPVEGPTGPLPDVPHLSPLDKRSSISSYASSSASSSSSLLTPSLSTSTTVSSTLSAIPESPGKGKMTGTAADQIHQRLSEEAKRRANNRLSGSSMASSGASSASSSYATNLRRSRPPSIAQVLESSPIMEGGGAGGSGLEKHRQFGVPPSTAAK